MQPLFSVFVQFWNNVHKSESQTKDIFLKGAGPQKSKDIKILISPHVWIVILCFVPVNFVLKIENKG